MTIYDEQLRGWLTARSFKLGWIPRTIVFEEDFWKQVNQEIIRRIPSKKPFAMHSRKGDIRKSSRTTML